MTGIDLPRPAAGAGEGRRVAVVGGGAVGVTAAHDLAAAGAEVTLFERHTIASGASGRAAGICYDAFAEDVDAAVAARAMERFRNLAGDGFDLRDCPYVMFAREGDDQTAEAIEASVGRMRTHGRDVSVVDPADLADRFGLHADDLAAVAVAENAGWTDPEAYTAAMAGRAAGAGAEIRTETAVRVETDPVRVVEREADEASERETDETAEFDAVLVAAGAHTRDLLADAGIEVPLKAYRVQALVSAAGYAGPMCFDATEDVYFRPHPVGLLAGDGTKPVEVDPDEWDEEADEWFVDDVRSELAHRANHALDLDHAWAGLCTATPDGDPLLGEVAEDVHVAAGWQGHGFMRAPATGELAAAAVLGDEGVAQFDPDRFEGDEEFDIAQGMTVE